MVAPASAQPTTGARRSVRQQSRARYTDATGYVERGGVRVFYEVYGDGEPTVLLLPTWSIVHSRIWKQQVPYLSRHFRILTFDGRGNGRSDRPAGVEAYADVAFVDDAIAVLDATGTAEACIVGLSMGAGYALRLAAEHPERVSAAVFEGPAVPLGGQHPERSRYPVDEPIGRYRGWAKYNHNYWREDYPDFLEFFFSKCFSEAHSTKQIEDAVGWGLETDAETLISTNRAPYLMPDRRAGRVGDDERIAMTLALAERVRCPSLVIHGTGDEVKPFRGGWELADALGGELVRFEGSGHIPSARDPVRFNLVVREFVDRSHRRDAPKGAADARPRA
jgi:pimeloyl-ACP methyl ester carboxylesterase